MYYLFSLLVVVADEADSYLWYFDDVFIGVLLLFDVFLALEFEGLDVVLEAES